MINRFIYLQLFVMLVSSCQQKKQATLAPEYLFDAQSQEFITSLVDSKNKTISVVYGNPLALKAACDSLPNQLVGAEYTLVTWKQKEMPGWYGTNMNGELYSVETLNVFGKDEESLQLSYHFHIGKACSDTFVEPDRNARIKLITGQHAAVFP